MKSKVIRVGIFDQIVSGGGVRLFTTKLLEEFSRLAGDKWRFHLMWPLFDSSNTFLPRPKLPHATFERISIDPPAGMRNRVVPQIQRFLDGGEHRRKVFRIANDGLDKYEKSVREHEQEHLRSGKGQGLRWLDERISQFNLIFFPYPYLTLPRNCEWHPSKPAVITLHDLAHEQTDAWGEMTESLRAEVSRWTRISRLVIFSSDYIKCKAQQIYGLPEERTKRIYLSPSEDDSTREKSGDVLASYGLHKEYILTLGWAAKHKRVETIIEGFALFKDKSKRDIALVIAGPRTEELISESTFGLEVGRDLFALGYVRDEQIPALYKNSSLVVTASISEAGLNAMIFDAMKYGKAVVCSNIPQFTERLGTDDLLALTFNPFSPQSLAAALSEHFDNPERSEKRIERSKNFINSRTLSEVGQEYLDAFESAL